MNRHRYYLLALSIFIVVVFIGFYYISNNDIFMKKNDGQEIAQNDPESGSLIIELNPGEEEYRLDGTVVLIDRSSDSPEIVITPFFSEEKFSAIPVIGKRRVMITDETEMTEGRPFTESTNPIGINDLQEGDRLVIKTSESILDIVTRMTYTAILIRKVIMD